jgi:hypothetical protein
VPPDLTPVPAQFQELEAECWSLREARDALQVLLTAEEGKALRFEAALAAVTEDLDAARRTLAQHADDLKDDNEARRMERMHVLFADDLEFEEIGEPLQEA